MHYVHYDTKTLYCMLSSSLKIRKEPMCVPGRELNCKNLIMAGRGVNNRALCGNMMLEIVPVVWKFSVLIWGSLAKMLSTKCTMVCWTYTVCYPHRFSSGKEPYVCLLESNRDTLVAGGRLANNKAVCYTPMLEAVPVVWKVGYLELWGLVKMLGTKCTMERRTSTVHYPHHCSSGKEPHVCQKNHETLAAAGRHANNRAMCHTLMLEAVPLVWKVKCPELGRMVKMLGKKCTMERRTYTVRTPHHCSAVKETGVYRERIVPETLVAAVRHTNNRAMCHTLMLETVLVVWKVGCPELGETGKDAGHGVHYDTKNLYCTLSSSLKIRKEP